MNRPSFKFIRYRSGEGWYTMDSFILDPYEGILIFEEVTNDSYQLSKKIKFDSHEKYEELINLNNNEMIDETRSLEEEYHKPGNWCL